jgi:AbrB family looped-hinge helix DNA binding protein
MFQHRIGLRQRLHRFDKRIIVPARMDCCVSQGSRFDASFRNPLERSVVRRYLTDMKTTVSSKGQIVLPAELRQQDNIEAGQVFEVERIDRGDYRIVRQSVPANEGLVDWLLDCPEKDYFIPIESESTDTL